MNIKELARGLNIELESVRISIDRLYDRAMDLEDEENINKMSDCFEFLEKINEIVSPMCDYKK